MAGGGLGTSFGLRVNELLFHGLDTITARHVLDFFKTGMCSRNLAKSMSRCGSWANAITRCTM